jgi:hypothetical protein
MSADNGIYILETEGPEYRVAHMQAVENYMWDEDARDYSNNPDVHIRNARTMWRNCKAFTNKMDAANLAFEMEEKILSDDFYPILECGISTIKIPRKF